jgi:hypothetical protein
MTPDTPLLGTSLRADRERQRSTKQKMNSGMIGPVLILAMILGLVAWMWLCIIRGIIQRRRDRESVRQQCRDAREKIMADGKIEGPKGIYRPKRWASTWVAYSHDLPAPRAQAQHLAQFSELPNIPTRKDE